MEGVIGEIRMFAGNFAPTSWAFCNGDLKNISEYESLYTILGTNYGGDGNVTFALPDLRGRIPVGTGTGPGLPTIELGEMGGDEQVVLMKGQMPAHTHVASIGAYANGGTDNHPKNKNLGGAKIYTKTGVLVKMADNNVSLSLAGSGQSHNNVMPVLPLMYIICVEGIYPTRA